MLEMILFQSYLERHAIRTPDKLAIACGDKRISYRELDEKSSNLASHLRNHGVARGDRVAVFLDNSIETAVSIFGVLKAGAVFSVVNPGMKEDKLALILNDCEAKALIAQNRLLKCATEACNAAPSVECRIAIGAKKLEDGWQDFDQNTTALSQKDRPSPGISIDLAMIVYTSGSTGRPKGVMMTHENVDAASWSVTTYLENRADDVILCCLPLSFDYGLYQLLMSCRLGATIILEKSFTYPAAALEKIRKWKVTGLPLVPTMAAILAQLRDFEDGSLPHLRYITNTAAALPTAHIERLQQMFPGAKLFSMYGLTECKRCTYLPPDFLTSKPTSVGIAIPGTEAFVLDDEGKPVDPGETGVLYIRGRTVMKGYWNRPDETNKMLKVGPYPWEKILCTQDLFTVDEDGFLYFVGRSDDIIKTRGEKVSPKEVEEVIHRIPGVVEAAVVGVEDDVLGAAVKAFLVVDADSDVGARDVQSHCAKHLEPFMVPKFVEFQDSLPKTSTGKVAKRQLA